MSVLIILIGASILVAVGFLIAFIWSVKTGQYEDDYTPSVRMLFENTPIIEKYPKDTNVLKHSNCTTVNTINTQTNNNAE